MGMEAVYTFSLHSTYNSVTITVISEYLNSSMLNSMLAHHFNCDIYGSPYQINTSDHKLFASDKCSVRPVTVWETMTRLVQTPCVKYKFNTVHIHHFIVKVLLTWTSQSGIIRMRTRPRIAYLILIVLTV